MLPPKIVVCSGTRCLLNESLKIKEEIANVLKEYDLLDKVMLFPCGCFGLCQIGPTVAVITETVGKVVYVHVKENDVRRIIEETLIKGQIIQELLVENNINYEMLDPSHNIK